MGTVLNYQEEATRAMTMLAEHPKTLFLGQAVAYTGQRLHQTYRDVPLERRIEMPVAEDFQMGYSVGLALEGYIPVTVYPRWDFLLLAANQLVNHLDKLPLYSDFRPKLIVRTAVGATKPLDPGPQHRQNHTLAFIEMLDTVEVVEIMTPEAVSRTYRYALDVKHPVIVVEHMSQYT